MPALSQRGDAWGFDLEPPKNSLQPRFSTHPLRDMLLRSNPGPKEILSTARKPDTLNVGRKYV